MEKPASKNAEFERVFMSFDSNGDGKISPRELRLIMRTIGEDLSMEDAEDLVKSTDSDDDGLLDFDDLLRLVGDDEEEEDGDLREAFGLYEMEGEGCITPKSLKRMLSKLGMPKDIEDCTKMICSFDLNGDGVLTFDEFRNMMI